MNRALILSFAILLASCAETNFYQVYQTKLEGGSLTNSTIVFEDKNCKVFYNLWTEGGDIGFSIFNKTNTDITINLDKTFFVLNGVAYEYYKNRSFSNSSTSGATVGVYSYPNNKTRTSTKVEGTGTSGRTITYVEKPILTIPSNTSVNVSEYQITNLRYRNCDLSLYPSSDNLKTVKFDKSNSPFVFYNLITYKIGGDSIRFENKFYVDEITNYPASKMFQTIDTSACGDKLTFPIQVFKNSAPNKFYFRYSQSE